jgi:hypothetical protein
MSVANRRLEIAVAVEVRRTLLALLVALVVVSGCGDFRPGPIGPGEPTQAPDQTHPAAS